jgi:hypothetical protein
MQVVKALVPLISPRGRGKWVSQQETSPVIVISQTYWYPGEKRYGGGFKRVLKEQGEIELMLLPFPGLVPNAGQARAIINQDLINKVRIDENVSRARPGNQSNAGLGKYATQFTQSGHSHYRIANPVGNTDDNF